MQPRSPREQARDSQLNQLQDKLNGFYSDMKVGLVLLAVNVSMLITWVAVTRTLNIFTWMMLALAVASLSLYVGVVWRAYRTETRILKLTMRPIGRLSLDD